MRSYKTEGIIIKRKNIGESDKLITVLTRNFGKIRLKATGVRKISSRRSPHVEPLNLASLSFYKGKYTPVLTEAYTKKSFSKIKCDLKKVGYAYYVCELIDVLCPDDLESERIFILFEEILESLAKEDNPLLVIKQFEINLLKNLGYFNHEQDGKDEDLSIMVEQIIERKLKTKQILPRLI